MIRTIILVLAVVALGAAAQTPTRFTRVEAQGPGNSSVKPLSVSSPGETVVVILAGDSVAQAQANAGRKLTQQEKNAIKTARKTDQQAITSQIQASGGTILNTFQSAINGIKVKIARNQVDALRAIPGVIDVKPVRVFTHENVVGVPRIQAPAAWAGVPGFRGEGVKVAIIDTGIDYTHANFGGPGTVAAFDAAFATNTAPADPSLFGPNAPKVKGGIDLVGDDYDANDPTSVPQPDPNPLDCNGHGSHVAGTAAGFGVLANGTTYTGPYDLTTYANTFTIGPGVAPKADLYAIRVFGCSGSTNVVVDALDWAVDNDMDVVNMSLGADFAPGDDADSLATDNAVKAGIIVASAAGNAGDVRYITGSPGNSLNGLGVAAAITPAAILSANIALPLGTKPSINAQDSNNAPFASPLSLQVVVLKDASKPGGVSLGCNPAEYTAAGVAGKLVVAQRGTCARVARAIFGQMAGASAVVLINNSASLPPFEGPITEDPDNGLQFVVTIPFFGVRGLVTTAASDGAALVANDGQTVTLTAGPSTLTGLASFSSGGPRSPDGLLKPDITAPGNPIISTAIGTGNQGVSESGTSMATPHVAGTAALGRQAHPGWTASQVKSAIINSGTPSAINGFVIHNAGTGLVNAASVAHTQVYATADNDATAMNFGVTEFTKDFNGNGTIQLRNDGSSDASFNVAVEQKQGSPHNTVLSTSLVKVKAHSTATVNVSLNVPAATAGNSLDFNGGPAFREIAGIVAFTPVSGADNAGVALRVPYYLVSRVSANVSASINKMLTKNNLSGNVTVTNKGSLVPGTADFYSWGLQANGGKKNKVVDLNVAGVQSFPGPCEVADDAVIAFAVNVNEAWSAPQQREFDVSIDLNGDGIPEFVVFNVDAGLLFFGAYDGQMVAAVFDVAAGSISAVDFTALAPTDSSTMVLPVCASDIGVTPANPRFGYTVQSFDLESSATDSFSSFAPFNAFNSSISNGAFAVIPPGGSATVPVSVNAAEFAVTPALGIMVITPDNKNGPSEVNTIGAKF